MEIQEIRTQKIDQFPNLERVSFCLKNHLWQKKNQSKPNIKPKKKQTIPKTNLCFSFGCIWILVLYLYLILGCSPKKLFSCQLCGKVLCSKASLKRHIADKHAERQEEYRCIICERVYCSRNSLMTHIYTYHKSRPGDHQLEMKDIKFY